MDRKSQKRKSRCDSDAKDHVSVAVNANGRTVSFTESEREGITTAATQLDGRVSLFLSGHSPQNEQDTVKACNILIEAMNKAGASWAISQPSSVEGDSVDCRVRDIRSASVLEIQVVRAIADEEFWRSLNTAGSLEISPLPTDLVQMIRAATEKKLNHYGGAEKSTLVLALDANRIPAAALHDVVDLVRSELDAWLSNLGFREVWLIGPVPALTHKLFPDAAG